MLASADDVAAIQERRLKSSEKSKLTRDHNGFRKLIIVLTKAGKLFALHTGYGQVVWSLLLPNLRKSECKFATGLNIYQWQVPHHHAMDENPSILIVGRCGQGSDAPGVLSIVDAYTGTEVNSMDLGHSISQVIPLPFTDSTEQRLHLLIDGNQHAYLYPRTSEAIDIFQREFSNIYWYSVETNNGIIKGHVLKSNCIQEVIDNYCFESRDIWSIIFPTDSEKIITTVTRKPNEVCFCLTELKSDCLICQFLHHCFHSQLLIFLFIPLLADTCAFGHTHLLLCDIINISQKREMFGLSVFGICSPVYTFCNRGW